ncbi:hypothetical protein HG537_0D00510 [Torulaspora globosa]|uniref:Uncharacterized protein n=1 Tax=Torulaspora globosa TaxID=48254 RepID=A0A7H9HRY2_9SACH|nr:hypothetical protein HG537_0D00510 [Torulaspora sp. CBS 2947]
MALIAQRLVARLYQLSHISSGFLYVALLARWLIIVPLAGTRFLPGGIHEFLCGLLVYSSVVELLWLVKFRGVVGAVLTRKFLKDVNFLYFVMVMHYYDDYEHVPVLKNVSYSSFIVGLACTQAWSHWRSLFKRPVGGRRSSVEKIDTYLMMPLLYLSEMYLLLLHVQDPGFHSFPLLDKVNKVVLVIFLPVALSVYRYQF